MFTGLIEHLGKIADWQEHEAGARITIEQADIASQLGEGDSVSVNGVCLTALGITDSKFAAEVSPETIDRTSLSRLNVGSAVNLELAVTPSTRLGGHIVQGHVDATGKFVSAVSDGEFWTVTIEFPPQIARYIVEKGSISVDGISLTVAALREDEFDIAIIPKTWELTCLSELKPGDEVNLEVDVIAKYVERMMALR